MQHRPEVLALANVPLTAAAMQPPAGIPGDNSGEPPAEPNATPTMPSIEEQQPPVSTQSQEAPGSSGDMAPPGQADDDEEEEEFQEPAVDFSQCREVSLNAELP